LLFKKIIFKDCSKAAQHQSCKHNQQKTEHMKFHNSPKTMDRQKN